MNLKVIQKNNLRNTCAYLDVNGKEMVEKERSKDGEVSSLVSQWKLRGSLGRKGGASYVSTGKRRKGLMEMQEGWPVYYLMASIFLGIRR